MTRGLRSRSDRACAGGRPVRWPSKSTRAILTPPNRPAPEKTGPVNSVNRSRFFRLATLSIAAATTVQPAAAARVRGTVEPVYRPGFCGRVNSVTTGPIFRPTSLFAVRCGYRWAAGTGPDRRRCGHVHDRGARISQETGRSRGPEIECPAWVTGRNTPRTRTVQTGDLCSTFFDRQPANVCI